jgi:hypothetical protein
MHIQIYLFLIYNFFFYLEYNMQSLISHKIKQRKTPKDIFITPKELAKSHIDMIKTNNNEIWLDPCRFNENGSYYSQFHNNKDWCEITEDKDFLSYTNKIDVICGNPPYSLLDKWFKKSIELNPRVISYLIGINNLTARRLEWFQDAGYGLSQMKMLKIFSWYGMSVICIWEKNTEQIMQYDRKIWKNNNAII